MNEEQMFYCLEQLNREKQCILRSKWIKRSIAIAKYIENFRRLRFSKICKDIRNYIAARKIRKLYDDHFRHEYAAVEANDNYRTAKIAVYTCITGGYDICQEPLPVFDNVDYYLIISPPPIYGNSNSVYKVVALKPETGIIDNISLSRYVKMHPFDYFPDYDYSIYMDANIRAIGDIRKFVNRCSDTTGLALHRHRSRSCIYNEAEACKLLRRSEPSKVDDLTKKYRERGFPHNYGLYEAGVIACDLNNPEAKRLLHMWWEEFSDSKTMRDQLSLPFVMWKNGYKIDDIGNLGNDISKNYKIEIVSHKRERV